MRRRGQSGAAALEFALLVPVLIILLFGIINYGYLLSFRQSLSQAATEGARAAAVAPVGERDREGRALAAVERALTGGVTCSSAGMSCDDIRIAACPAPAEDRQCAFIRLVYDYEAEPLMPTLPGLGPLMPDRLVYEAVAEVST